MIVKKTRIVVLLLLFGTSYVAKSQTNTPVRWGVFGGVNFAKQNGDAIQITDLEGKKLEMNTRVTFHAGVSAEVNLGSNFYLQPELYYSGAGFKTPTINGKSGKINMSYINLPVLVKYKFNNSGWGIFAGPQYGVLLSAKAKGGDTDVDIKDACKKSEFSGLFGLEYYMPSGLGFSAQYQAGFTNVYKTEGSDGSKVKNGIFSVSIGYRF